MKYILLTIFLLSSSYLFFKGLQNDPTYIPSNLIYKEAPHFNLETMDNNKLFSSKDLESNEIKILNFFASWCPPCKIEHPQLTKLSEKYKVYGIAKKDEKKKLIKWLDDLGNPFQNIGLDNDGMTSINWGVYGLPETFFINKEGMIIYKHIGPIMKKDLEYIHKLINDF